MSIKAWWRGRGFGVHSPFAFRFITDVLHHDDAYAYYAYDDLKERWSEARHRDRISLRELLAIYRVGIWAAPERVKLCGADP